jgi:lysophospholipase L1-like esterase
MRIATLGDSCTFGVGAHDDETWSARLAERLKERGVEAEVLNGGVDGFTVRQGLERYRSKVRPYKPDVVVAAFGVVNEHWSADETDEVKIARMAARRRPVARLVRWIRHHSRIVQALEHWRNPRAAEELYAQIDKRTQIQQFLAPHAGQIEWPFDRRVSLDSFKAAIAALKAEVEADGGRLIVIAMPRRPEAEDELPILRRYTRAVNQVAQEQDLQILNAYARFRYAHVRGLQEPDWMIHDWWHPSPAGHAKIAEWLAPLVIDPRLCVGQDGVGEQPQ